MQPAKFLYFHRTLHEKAVLWYSIQSSISKVSIDNHWTNSDCWYLTSNQWCFWHITDSDTPNVNLCDE